MNNWLLILTITVLSIQQVTAQRGELAVLAPINGEINPCECDGKMRGAG